MIVVIKIKLEYIKEMYKTVQNCCICLEQRSRRMYKKLVKLTEQT